MFGIDDAISKVSELVDDVVKRIWPDATEIEKAKLNKVTEELKIKSASLLGQLAINEKEAEHPSVFVAGWRPFLGWIGGLAIGYNFLLMPILNGVVGFFGIPPVFVPTPTDQIMSLIGGLTGLVIARSADKYSGVSTKKLVNNK